MARRANEKKWTLPDGVVSYEAAQLAVSMDIRDELQAIRRLIECPNVGSGFVAMQAAAKLLKCRLPPHKKRKARRV